MLGLRTTEASTVSALGSPKHSGLEQDQEELLHFLRSMHCIWSMEVNNAVQWYIPGDSNGHFILIYDRYIFLETGKIFMNSLTEKNAN